MKKSISLILIGLACLMLMAAGCTSTSDPTPAMSWDGIWSTTWTSADHATLIPGDDITFTQTGSSVTGTYVNPEENFSGSITGTVEGNTLTGTWSENGLPGTSGTMVFVMSADGNTFSGTWESADDTTGATYLWNGVRK
ncbi:hypothetical protein J2T58_002108 [Methanocalculus alkaliphilus]|uniref:hypothetical protein n=1 Tax=Methanocalculus alkaliphilus TaxID=768730 RepID=UPI00209D73F9|nr:hypothetical protein [Methanocalculus alkaliphilus]MCP1716232.1 hypothetical protein [Methanocalculus alkaliphilus]